jgi:hypothetical protein
MQTDTTAAKRQAHRRRMVNRLGFDPFIPEETADELSRRIAEGWEVVKVEFGGPSIHFAIRSRLDVSEARRREISNQLSAEFGNPPHTLWTDFTSYRMSFGKN